MNLRILKKLSKKAAPLLPVLGDGRKQFAARPFDSYHASFISDRKHWERRRCHPTYEGRNDWGTPKGAEILFVTRSGRHMVMKVPSHPRKGTIMVGATTGYYEPEWDEESAWSALENIVRDRFTDYDLLLDDDYEGGVLTRDLSSPALILAAAREMVAEKGGAR